MHNKLELFFNKQHMKKMLYSAVEEAPSLESKKN